MHVEVLVLNQEIMTEMHEVDICAVCGSIGRCEVNDKDKMKELKNKMKALKNQENHQAISDKKSILNNLNGPNFGQASLDKQLAVYEGEMVVCRCCQNAYHPYCIPGGWTVQNSYMRVFFKCRILGGNAVISGHF